MKYRYLGRSGLLVSRICLGTMTFGNTEWGCDLDTSRAIVNAFIAGGGNFIDTADAYVNGESERMLAAILKDHKRDDLVIATKGFFPTGDAVTARGLSRKHIHDACEQALQALGQGLVGEIHAREHGVAADRRRLERVQQRAERRPLEIGGVGMPDAAEIDPLVRLLDDRQHQRALGQALDQGVFDGLAEALGERQQLTRRERQVLLLVVSGLPNKRVACELSITEATVKIHRGQVMHKMHAGSLAELVRMASRISLPIRRSENGI